MNYIYIILCINFIYTLSIWYYRIDNIHSVLPIICILVATALPVIEYRKKYKYLIIVYVLLWFYLNGVIQFVDIFYPIIKKPTFELSLDFYVMTYPNSPRLESFMKWWNEYSYDINVINNTSNLRGNKLYASDLEYMYTNTTSDYVVLFEDDAVPSIKNWFPLLVKILYSNYEYDVIFLDHRAFLSKHFSLFIPTTGTVAVIYKTKSLDKIYPHMSTGTFYNENIYDVIISELCANNIITCRAYFLFKESGAVSVVKH